MPKQPTKTEAKEFTTAPEVVDALRSTAARRVGIDGTDGVGKSTLARTLANELAFTLLSLDDYLEKRRGGFVEYIEFDRLRAEVSAANEYVVEGICLLEVLERAGINSLDELVYIKCYDQGAWSNERELDLNERNEQELEAFLEKERYDPFTRKPGREGGLDEEIIRYHYSWRPHKRAAIIFRRDG